MINRFKFKYNITHTVNNNLKIFSILDINKKKRKNFISRNTFKSFYKKIPSPLRKILNQKPKRIFNSIPIIKRKRRHKERRIRFSFKKAQPYRKRKIKKHRKRQKKRKLIFENHYLTITGTVKNFFLAFYQKILSQKKRKKKRIILINLLASKSIGALGYKGRKKTSPLAKEFLGKNIGNSIKKSNIQLLDIILKKKIGYVYKPILKGLTKTQLLIRKIHINSVHPHGFLRPKKKKRK